MHKINLRIGAVTGMDLSTAESLQVSNYGLGGHYEPHYDWGNAANYVRAVHASLSHHITA